MKLSGRDAKRYFARPDPEKRGLLIHGGDAMRVALRRQEVIAALIGPAGEEEMRLTRIAAAELRKDPAWLIDALKAQGFFPGPRVVFVEDAGDGLSAALSAALDDWRPGDAVLVVTAGQLAARSSLRKLFEAHPDTCAAAIYDDPPGREEIAAALKAAGLGALDREAEAALQGLALALDPGDFRQTVEKLGLYKLGDPAPVSAADIAAVAPLSVEAALDDVVATVAEGRAGEIGPLMRRLAAQGVQPVSLCIGATRHFRQLHAAAADPSGPGPGIARVRPPVFGPRRERMVRQAQGWGLARLEAALHLLTDTDLTLRSSAPGPALATVERAFIRLAMMGRR